MAVILASPEVQKERKKAEMNAKQTPGQNTETPSMRREMLDRKEKNNPKGFKMKNST